MSEQKIDGFELKPGFKGMASDTGSDQTMFKGVHWGKAMMWIFLLSDTFVFSCFFDISPLWNQGFASHNVIPHSSRCFQNSFF